MESHWSIISCFLGLYVKHQKCSDWQWCCHITHHFCFQCRQFIYHWKLVSLCLVRTQDNGLLRRNLNLCSRFIFCNEKKIVEFNVKKCALETEILVWLYLCLYCHITFDQFNAHMLNKCIYVTQFTYTRTRFFVVFYVGLLVWEWKLDCWVTESCFILSFKLMITCMNVHFKKNPLKIVHNLA